MKRLKYTLAMFVTVLSLAACELDHQPTDGLTYPDPYELFSTYDEAEKFAQGLPAFFRKTQQGNNWESSEIQCDMFSAASTYGNVGGLLHTMGAGFVANDYDTKELWDKYYQLIAQTNLYIANIDNVNTADLSAEEQASFAQWEGQARFFRAYAYHQLVLHFSLPYNATTAATDLGLPLVTSLSIDFRPARSTVQQTYDYIQEDLTQALALLSTTTPEVRSILPTIDAAHALQARVSLSIGDYPAAIAAADAVIGSSAGYALSTTAEALAKEFITQDGTESILLLDRIASLSSTDAPNITYFLRYNGDDKESSYTAYYFPNQRLIDLYSDTDIRKNVYLLYGETINVNSSFTGGVLFGKYRGNPALTTNKNHAAVTRARVLALPEMYLIKAEAQAQSSGDAKATLNELQTARGVALTDGSMGSIKTEWARETVGEGHRLTCLKRWGDGFVDRPQPEVVFGGEKVTYLVAGQGFNVIDVPANATKFITWPIPNTDIQTNPNLVQNPGW